MDDKHPRCAGLDVHKKSVVACVRVAEGGQVKRERRRFATTTSGLCQLADWLVEHGCTHAVMESTGVYWKPVWHVLEGHVELLLVNPHHVRQIPGRKSDMNDATWLAELLALGLLRGSFVPPEPIRELRDLTRTRVQLVGEVRQHTQRIQKVLHEANVQLAGLCTDMLGRTGRAVLDALAEGETDPERLADLCKRLRKYTRAEQVEALNGHMTEHHRFLLKMHLKLIDDVRAQIEVLEQRIEDKLRPFREDVERLCTLPGVSLILAAVLVAEIGTDMSRFPTAGHLVSWAGLCPRQDESAGKHHCTRIRKSSRWLRSMLVQAAWVATRSRDNRFRRLYYRVRRRRGPQKAIIAAAAAMLRTVYVILRDQVPYDGQVPERDQRLDKRKQANKHVRHLRALGYEVQLIEQAA